MSDRPVKVTAYLATPLALSPEGYAPHLDALVEWAVSSRMRSIEEASNGRHKVKRRGEGIEKQGTIPVPIDRKMVNDIPIPRCSFGIIAENRERQEHYSRRFPFERASSLHKNRRTVIQTTGGAYKSFRLPLRVIDVDKIVWFAVLRESPTNLRKELKRIDCIGKKSSYGYGFVWKWEVERINDDFSWFAETENKGFVLMRALPVSVIGDAVLGGFRTMCGVAPPYWQRDFWVEAYAPC